MKKIFIYGIRLYQKTLSLWIGNDCRFFPSCSHYAIECLEKLPLYKAIFYIAYRIIRCQPLSKGGFDPVSKVQRHNTLKNQKKDYSSIQ